jgi:hypothetical protein
VDPQFNSMVSVYQPRLTVPGGTIDAQVQGEPRVNANEIIPKVGEGSVWIHADVFAYGARLRDSVQYTFSYAYAASFDIRTNQIRLGLENAANRTVYLAPGGTLSIMNSYADSVGVSITASFSGPSTPAEAIPASSSGGSSGDMTPISGGQSSRRRFLTPGRYTWTITAESSTGLFNNTASGIIFVK